MSRLRLRRIIDGDRQLRLLSPPSNADPTELDALHDRNDHHPQLMVAALDSLSFVAHATAGQAEVANYFRPSIAAVSLPRPLSSHSDQGNHVRGADRCNRRRAHDGDVSQTTRLGTRRSRSGRTGDCPGPWVVCCGHAAGTRGAIGRHLDRCHDRSRVLHPERLTSLRIQHGAPRVLVG